MKIEYPKDQRRFVKHLKKFSRKRQEAKEREMEETIRKKKEDRN